MARLPNITDRSVDTFLRGFEGGASRASRQIENDKRRQFEQTERDRLFGASRADAQFRQDIASSKEGRAATEFEAGAPQRQLDTALATGRLGRVDEQLDIEGKVDRLGLEKATVDVAGAKVKVRLTREQIKSVISKRKLLTDSAATQKKAIETLTNEASAAPGTPSKTKLTMGEFIMGADKLDRMWRAKFMLSKKAGIAGLGISDKEFEEGRKALNVARAEIMDVKRLILGLEAAKKDVGLEDFKRSAGTLFGSFQAVAAVWPERGARARKLRLLNADNIERAMGAWEREPNSQRIQVLLTEAKNVGEFTSDQEITRIQTELTAELGQRDRQTIPS